MKVKAILTKPLDGFPEGAEREFDKVEFDKLVEYGAVRAADEGKKAARAPQNKKAPAVDNKSADTGMTTDPVE